MPTLCNGREARLDNANGYSDGAWENLMLLVNAHLDGGYLDALFDALPVRESIDPNIRNAYINGVRTAYIMEIQNTGVDIFSDNMNAHTYAHVKSVTAPSTGYHAVYLSMGRCYCSKDWNLVGHYCSNCAGNHSDTVAGILAPTLARGVFRKVYGDAGFRVLYLPKNRHNIDASVSLAYASLNRHGYVTSTEWFNHRSILVAVQKKEDYNGV